MSISKFNYEDDFNYIRISPSILYSIKDEDLRSNFRKYFVLRHINIKRKLKTIKMINTELQIFHSLIQIQEQKTHILLYMIFKSTITL